jgi:hypothetical protein
MGFSTCDAEDAGHVRNERRAATQAQTPEAVTPGPPTHEPLTARLEISSYEIRPRNDRDSE